MNNFYVVLLYVSEKKAKKKDVFIILKKIFVICLIQTFLISLFVPLTYADLESNDLLVKPPSSVFADWQQSIVMQIDNPYMSINGSLQEIDLEHNATPTLINDTTMIPIKSFVDQLGGELIWNEEKSEVTVNLYSKTIVLYINQTKAYDDGEEKEIQAEPVIINERTYVPLRFISEEFKCKVEWNADNQYIKIAPNETYVTTFKELNAILNMRQFRWGGAGFSNEYSKIINNIRINSGDKFEQELYKLLENDMDGCYFCGSFLIDEESLYGNTPLPDVALKVFDIGLALPCNEDDEKYTKVSLSIVAAIANKKYGNEEKAKNLKSQAEEMMKNDPVLEGAFPALYEEDRKIYDNL